MNIFVLDSDPFIAAQYYCDIHNNKMILEMAQMLSTAHRVLDGIICVQYVNGRKTTTWNHANDALYKATHVNHPCSIWIRETESNYQWAYKHFFALCNEFLFRRDKRHKTDIILRDILKKIPKNISDGPLTKFAIAINDRSLVNENDIIESYRRYYKTKEKSFDMKWTRREVPSWFNLMETATNANLHV
jgi:hypothetical protein